MILPHRAGLRAGQPCLILKGMAKIILEEVLKRRKLSKRQLSIRMGIRYEHVFRFFRKGYNPRFSTLNLWAKAIGCKVRDLIKE